MHKNGRPDVTILRANRPSGYPDTTEDFFETLPPLDDTPVQHPRKGRFSRFKRYVFLALLLAVSIFVCWQAFVLPWWEGVRDQWNYGSARVTQLDANVGHDGGVSHFIAEYYRQQILIYEIPLAKPQDTHVYSLSGMIGGAAPPVILLSVADTSHNGQPDLIIQIEGSNLTIVLYNNGSTFQRTQLGA